MSWDQQTYSFGNPNAQPPTPTQTPTSAAFQSPTFETPRNSTHTFDNRTGWSPTFAEEYSVFNATPGRLTSSHDPFGEISTPRPTTASSGTQLLAGAGEPSVELASHVHHLSTQHSLSLPSVDPSAQLSSPRASSFHGKGFEDKKSKVTPRKPRRRLEEAFSGQTATPPQSATRPVRKLAPKLPADTMQHDEESFQPSSGTAGLPNLLTYSPDVGDMFSYPMSAPTFRGAKPFWEPDAGMTGMDMDMSFATDNSPLFDPEISQRMNDSFDWSRSGQIFQETSNVPQLDNSGVEPPKRQRPLAPKISLPGMSHNTHSTAFSFTNASIADDPFAMVASTGAVDPGLLFAFPETSSSNTNDPKPGNSITSRSQPSVGVRRPYEHQQRELERDEELRRSRVARETSAGARHDRASFSSPAKKSNRPGIQRSVSDRPKTAISQKTGHFTSVAPRLPAIERRSTSKGGRTSPVKQNRSLSSIPETVPGTRTSVTFSIDANGRARAETKIIPEEPKSDRRDPSSIPGEDWDSSNSGYSSDEDPIILPSRSTSFSLPQIHSEGPKLAQFESTSQSFEERRRSFSSPRTFSVQGSQQDQESEAETVIDNDDGSGNAANALRKVMEDRKQRIIRQGVPQQLRYPKNTSRQLNSMPALHYQQQYNNQASSSNLSPTTVSDPDLDTPSTDRESSRSDSTRCVCNNRENDSFMIQCESCEKWLHAKCVGISRNRLPKVYICAFCAKTPNMRGGRIREPARGSLELGSSPLAHKSFKPWR